MADEATGSCCPKCGSKCWMTGLPLMKTRGIEVFVTPETWLDGPKGTSPFQVSVCGDCGYSEFHALNHKEMWEEWSR